MNLTKLSLIIFIVVLFGGVGVFLINFIRNEVGLNTNNNNFKIEKLNTNNYLVNIGEDKIEMGAEQTQTTSVPFAKLNRWDGDISMRVGYSQAKEKMNPVQEGGKLIWEGNKQEIHFYKIQDGQKRETINNNSFLNKWNPLLAIGDLLKNKKDSFSFFPQIKNVNAQEKGKLRYLNLGSIDPLTMSASYELFQKREPTTPILLSYLPSQDAFVFYGYRETDRDLKLDKITFPITRYKTVHERECPVIYANKGGVATFVLYYPPSSQKPEEYIKLVEEALNESLKKYNIEIQDLGHLLYYRDDLQLKQIGRISDDKNFIIFYIYLDSPLKKNEFIDATRPYIALRDSKVIPITGLREINKDITNSFIDDISTKIAEKINLNLTSDSLTAEETQIIDSLKPTLSSKDWIYQAERNGFKVKPEQPEGEKFEIELVLKEKPSTNIFNFDIDTKGLNFYYQPELTEEEKNQGAFRPEDIIGSYAVYYANQDKVFKTKEEADKYKTGKAFHIYRPKIKDNIGNEVWGQLNIYKDKNLLTVTVSQEFLDKATYPVSVDPTFGYTTTGGTQGDLASNTAIGSVFTTQEAGTATSISAYVLKSSSRKYAIYKHSDSSLLASTNASTTNISSPSWETLSVSTSLNNATDYVLAMTTGTLDGKETSRLLYDSGDANQGHSGSITAYPTLDNPITFSTHNTNKYSIYATYTAAPATSNMKFEGLKMEGIKIQ